MAGIWGNAVPKNFLFRVLSCSGIYDDTKDLHKIL